ncbi:MAG: hypothetical protein GKR89_18725 [Candidatus Latescibacteria bacterium]|nr:hypothetical protein [Candidatus Latescibacterota bacterium]
MAKLLTIGLISALSLCACGDNPTASGQQRDSRFAEVLSGQLAVIYGFIQADRVDGRGSQQLRSLVVHIFGHDGYYRRARELVQGQEEVIALTVLPEGAQVLWEREGDWTVEGGNLLLRNLVGWDLQADGSQEGLYFEDVVSIGLSFDGRWLIMADTPDARLVLQPEGDLELVRQGG